MNSRILVDLLLELNVINVKEVDQLLNKLAAHVANPYAVKWLKRVARYFVINVDLLRDTPRVVQHGGKTKELPGYKEQTGRELERSFAKVNWKKPKRKPVYGEPPPPEEIVQQHPWTASHQEKGTPLHYFDPVQPMRRLLWQQLDSAVDYFNSLPQESPVFRQLETMQTTDIEGFRNVIRRATKWKHDVKVNPWKYVPDRAETVLEFPNGAKLVKLLSKGALMREGAFMHHCVGDEERGYWRTLEDGTHEFYSLRNSAGRSNVTIDLELPNIVRQMKGYTNATSLIKPQYKELLRQAIAHFGWQVAGDQASIQ